MILRPTAVTACLLTAATSTWADRPLVSETADVIGDGTCQVEAFGGRTTTSGSPAVRVLAATFSCGVGSATQLAFGGAEKRGGGTTERTLVAGGKTTLLNPAEGRTGYGVAYSLDNVHTPGEGSSFDRVNIVGLATRELAGGVLMHLNLGWSRSRVSHLNSTVWSVGFETTHNPTVAFDLFGDDRGRPSTSAGVGFSITRDLSVNAAFATQWESPRIHQWTLGAKFVY